jgi:ankyrin repeat protein
MRIPRHSARLLLILLVSLVTIGTAVLVQAADDPALVVAAREGDFETVRALLAKRPNVNAPARDGATAVLWAVHHSDLKTVRALVAAGANLNIPNRYGVTPLLEASRVGDATLIAELLKAGADVKESAHPEGETPLMAAARTGKTDAVALLLKAGVDPNAADSFQKQTALMRAAEEGHVDVVNMLLAAKADPNAKAYISELTTRKNADHATGGLTALMFAVRNGHENVIRALVKGGADLKIANGDGVTATSIAIVNDRFDLARTLLDLGADPNDGALFFAVDMHDATSDMRARDGSRLRADHKNQLTALDLVKLLLERGADPNKPFVGQIHNVTLCCSDEHNATPFFRAAIASDVEVLKLMIQRGAQLDWSPTEVKKTNKDGTPAPGGRGLNAHVGKTAAMVSMVGGRGAPFAAGPGFERLIAAPFREPSNRDPGEALKVLLDAGANPNAKMPDGATLLHQAVTARRTDMIRALAAAGAKFDAVNKDNLTPLLLAEKPEPPPPPGNNNDARAWRPRRDSREDVIAAVREIGPNDPAPVPPPLPKEEKVAETK